MLMPTINTITGARAAPKAQQTMMEKQVLTLDSVNSWVLPDFQRDFRLTAKVKEHMDFVKATESIDGVITLGVIRADMERLKNGATVWLVDGQHRAEGFKLSGLEACFADVRVMIFDDMDEMAREYNRLNSHLRNMTPDDRLKSMERYTPPLAKIKKHCEFVGYGPVRRSGGSGPIVSMSSLVRCWTASQFETPIHASGAVANQAEAIDNSSAESLIQFMSIAYAAWSRDPEYGVLWNNLNLTICMWLWRRLVLDRERSGSKKYVLLNAAGFKQCLMALSAEVNYLDWLKGRSLTERDRGPAYARIKVIFQKRLAEDKGAGSTLMPKPAWAIR